MKEQQLSKEVERLQESVSYLAKDAEKKKRSEVGLLLLLLFPNVLKHTICFNDQRLSNLQA